MFYRLDRLSVVDFVGDDAAAILHTLTTNHVQALEPSAATESFVTNVKGKVVAHGTFVRQDDRFRFVGAAGQSKALVDHVDRYVIREACRPEIRDDEFVAIVAARPDDQARLSGMSNAETPVPIAWSGAGGSVTLVRRSIADVHVGRMIDCGASVADEAAFHDARIEACFPWFGVDLNDSNLPQEADRDDAAICFTKGCYLGQETVARLDAIGQVQRKLASIELSVTATAEPPAAGMTLGGDDGRPVMRLTSIASRGGTAAGDAPAEQGDSRLLALAFVRRSHFPTGSTASSHGVTARVR